MTEDTGGPAFPNQIKIIDEKFAELRGMTLRDYFAAKAMQGLLGSGTYEGLVNIADVALYSYKMADAMLKVRK